MPTYGKSFSVVLSSQNKLQLLVPKGFAHGFSVLSEEADVMYKCDALYNKETESGILFNDPLLGIDWQVSQDKMIVSEKDLILPAFDPTQIIF
jgi:dTDP-4-dehydrorhamnose 3,5-epimerase